MEEISEAKPMINKVYMSILEIEAEDIFMYYSKLCFH